MLFDNISYSITEDIGVNLAIRLRLAREAAGLTQSAVSRASGIAVPNLSRIESGKADLRLSTLDRVLDALGLDIQLVPRTTRVSIDEVVALSEQGRERLMAAGLGASSPRQRLDARQRGGIDITVEQTLLNADA
ncbi:MAG: helix-turn-helix transcriptional regulator [Actinobacteria bacterium]|nr:helix-turn-helix transcriptional regulator [Actinomycetota bacterium]